MAGMSSGGGMSSSQSSSSGATSTSGTGDKMFGAFNFKSKSDDQPANPMKWAAFAVAGLILGLAILRR